MHHLDFLTHLSRLPVTFSWMRCQTASVSEGDASERVGPCPLPVLSRGRAVLLMVFVHDHG